MDTLLQDVRFAARALAKSPGFTGVALLTLALGMGANAAIFSVVDALLVRPLPFPEPGRLVLLFETQPGDRERPVAPANFLDWRGDSRSFTGLAAYEEEYRNLVGTGRPARLDATTVSGNFFEVLGIPMARGHGFTPPGDGPRQAVVSHALWRDRFGSDPTLIGRSLRLDDESVVVVGVLRAGSAFPEGSEIWLRAKDDVPELRALGVADVRAMRDAHYFAVLGRLRQGVTPEAAQGEMDVIGRRLAAAYPVDNANAGVSVERLQDSLAGPSRPAVLLLMATVGLVLLLACGNVANLLLARGVRRSKEVAIRSALGAGRARIVRQLLTESALLAAWGGALGLVFAAWAGHALFAWLPETPHLVDARLSLPVLAFCGALVVAATVVFGLVPALQAARPDSLSALKDSGRTSAADPGRDRARAALVIGEVALALVLVTSAGLLGRSLWRLQETPSGMRLDGVVTARVSLPGAAGMPEDARRAFYARVLERLSASPGVEAVGATQTLPFGGAQWRAGLSVAGRDLPPNEQPDVCWRVATPGLFRSLGVPVVRGRVFADSDVAGAPPVAVINATLARTLFPGEDPVGRRIMTGLDGERDRDAWPTVVGVVGDAPQESVAAPVRPQVYRPLAQPNRFGGESLRLVARVSGDPRAALGAMRSAVAAIDPEAPVTNVATLDELSRGTIARQRVTGQILGAFAVVALLLAALGLYGVVAGLVAERTHEIGVRVALGAGPRDVLALVMGRSGRLVVAGVALGLLGTAAASRFLGSFLYGVTATDPATLAVVTALLAGTTAFASYIPARRASRVDPLVALRSE